MMLKQAQGINKYELWIKSYELRIMRTKKDKGMNNTALEPLAIGIDIGGTGTKYGIVDKVGNDRKKHPNTV